VSTALISRRALLRGSIVAAIGAGVGGLAWLRDAAAGFRVLAPEEVVVVEALAEAIFPVGNPMGLSWLDIDLAHGFDDVLADFMLPRNVPAIRYLLRTLELATLVARGLPFSACHPEMRVQIFEIWSQEDPFPRRLALDGLKGVMCMAYYDHPRVKKAIGWRVGCGG